MSREYINNIKKIIIKNRVNAGILFLVSIAIFLSIFFYFKNNKLDQNAYNYIPETSLIEIADVFSYSELGVEVVQPYVGFSTGIKEYPKLKWETLSIEEESPRVSINIKYPKFEGLNTEKLNKYLHGIVYEREIKGSESRFKELVKEDPESFLSSLDIASDYRIVGVWNGIVSMELVFTDFTGGGNGNHDVPTVINWDLRKDEIVKNDKIFCSSDYLSKIAPIARKKLIDRIPKDFDSSLFEDPEEYGRVIDWIKDGTEPVSENFENLIPYNGGLIVIFNPYQVHSGVSGIVRVFLEKKLIPDVLCI